MKALFTSAIALLLAAPLAARADIVITDWKTAGDQALMWDTVSDREWLRLPQTAGLSYQQVAAQLGAGGDYNGFTHADVADVWQLFDNAGLSPRYPAPDAEAKFFIGSWGLDGADGDTTYVTVRAITSDWYGLPDDYDNRLQIVAMVGYGSLEPTAPSWANATASTVSLSETRPDTGSALWRQRIEAAPATPLPEPGALLLAGTGLLALLGTRRRHDDLLNQTPSK